MAKQSPQQIGNQEMEESLRHVPGIDFNADGSAQVPIPTGEAEEMDIEELEDGSAVIKDAEEDAPADPNVKFGENLVKKVDETVLGQVVRDLLEAIDRDKDARKKRDEQYAEGIKRTGMGNEAPGGATFDGASRAVHPVLIEGCVDFAARAMKELFPAKGPVKVAIVGEATKAKLRRAERKKTYMNWQCTTQIREYRRELEVLLTQLPLGGGQYLKFWYDERWERIRTEFVAIDNLLLPFEATSLDTAERITHVQLLTRQIFRERIDSGMYEEPANSLSEPVQRPDRTKSQEAADKVEGVDDIGFNEDGQRTVYEVQVSLDLQGEDKLAKKGYAPYVITIDEPTQKAVALYRNWDEEDQDKMEALNWIVEFPFIPWRGAYPIGLTHLIGGLSGAATGALRALLDTALINNTPGAVKLKTAGSRTAGQNINVEPTSVTELDAGPGVDDIRKLVMPIPFNQPSPVLFQLLEFLTNQAKGVVATAEERIADASNSMPVGTALALIEQGSITFSAIHSRLHNSQKQALAIIHRLDAKYLSDHEVVEELGDLVTSRSDFQGPMDLEPVSDPNIFSDAQRYAQLQAAVQLAAQPMFTGLFKPPELVKRFLALLKFPEASTVLNVPEDPEELDPVSENVAAADPAKSVKVYDGQDHLIHLKVHLSFMTSPIFCANPLMAQPALGVLLNHVKEHLIELYQEHMVSATQAQMMLQRMKGSVEGAEADAVAIAEAELVKLLGPLMPMVQQAQQLAQQFAPKPMGDPQMAKVQADQALGQAKLQQEGQLRGQELQLKAQELAQGGQVEQAKLQQSGQALQQEAQKSQAEMQLEAMMAQMQDAFDRWDSQLEMSTSRANADAAAQEGERNRQLQVFLQELKGEQSQQLELIRQHFTTQVESIRQEFDARRQADESARQERERATPPAPPAPDLGPILEQVKQHGEAVKGVSQNMNALLMHLATKKPSGFTAKRGPDGSLSVSPNDE